MAGKNASLGEMFNQLKLFGIEIPNRFASTVEAYRLFWSPHILEDVLHDLLLLLDETAYSNLSDVGKKARSLILSTTIPDELIHELKTAYKKRCAASKLDNLSVAVQS